MGTKALVKIFVSILITAGIGFFLFRQVQGADIRTVLATLDWKFLFWSVVFFYASLVVRGLRFSLLLQESIPLFLMTDIMAVLAFFNAVLPARTGELSYLYFIRRNTEVSDGENITSLIIGRVFDALVAGAFAVGSSWGMYHIGLLQKSIFIGAVGLFVFSLIMLLAIISGHGFIERFARAIEQSRFSSKRIIVWSVKKLSEISDSFHYALQKSLLIQICIYTAVVWVLIFVFLWFLALSLHIQLPFWQGIFIFILPSIVGVLPIQPIGGIGLYEAAMMFGLLVLGFGYHQALQLSVVIHGLLLIMSFVFFCISLPRLLWHQKKNV